MSDTETDEWTPSTDQVRSHYVFNQSDQWDAERGEAFDRWLSSHDAEVRAQADAEIRAFREQYIPRLTVAERELAEVRADAMADYEPEKDERLIRYMAMVTPLGYQSALTVVQEMTKLIDAETRARGVVAEEPDWEYGWRDERPLEWSGRTNMPASIVKTVYPYQVNPQMVRVRRRKAGPWVPVEQEGQADDH